MKRSKQRSLVLFQQSCVYTPIMLIVERIMGCIFWAQHSPISSSHTSFLVMIHIQLQGHHIPLKYMCLTENTDHKMLTYILNFICKKPVKCKLRVSWRSTNNSKMGRSYWAQEHFFCAQGVYTRLWVQGLENWSGGNVTSRCRQTSSVPTQKTHS